MIYGRSVRIVPGRIAWHRLARHPIHDVARLARPYRRAIWLILRNRPWRRPWRRRWTPVIRVADGRWCRSDRRGVVGAANFVAVDICMVGVVGRQVSTWSYGRRRHVVWPPKPARRTRWCCICLRVRPCQVRSRCSAARCAARACGVCSTSRSSRSSWSWARADDRGAWGPWDAISSCPWVLQWIAIDVGHLSCVCPIVGHRRDYGVDSSAVGDSHV